MKAGSGYFEPRAQLVAKLNQEGEHTVVLVTGSRHEPVRHFELQGADQPVGADGRCRQFHQEGRGHRVRQVGHQFPSRPIARMAAEILQRVIMQQG